MKCEAISTQPYCTRQSCKGQDIFIRLPGSSCTIFYPFQIYHMNVQPFTNIVNYHWHPELEILMIHTGTLTVTDNQVSRIGAAGDILFIMPEHLHTMHSTAAPVIYDAFVFPLEFLSFALFDEIQNRYLLPLEQKKLPFPQSITASCCVRS